MKHLHIGQSVKLLPPVHLKYTCIYLLCLLSFSNPRRYRIALNKLLKGTGVNAEHLKWSYSPYRFTLLSLEEITLDVSRNSCASRTPGFFQGSLTSSAQGWKNSILPVLLFLLCTYEVDSRWSWPFVGLPYEPVPPVLFIASPFYMGSLIFPSISLQSLTPGTASRLSQPWQLAGQVLGWYKSALFLLTAAKDFTWHFTTALFTPQIICLTFMVLLACLANILKHLTCL